MHNSLSQLDTEVCRVAIYRPFVTTRPHRFGIGRRQSSALAGARNTVASRHCKYILEGEVRHYPEAAATLSKYRAMVTTPERSVKHNHTASLIGGSIPAILIFC